MWSVTLKVDHPRCGPTTGLLLSIMNTELSTEETEESVVCKHITLVAPIEMSINK